MNSVCTNVCELPIDRRKLTKEAGKKYSIVPQGSRKTVIRLTLVLGHISQESFRLLSDWPFQGDYASSFPAYST